jgi:2-haloacid dehalogenase
MNAKNANRAPLSAFVFDAYGTLFDVHSVARTAEQLFPGNGHAIAQVWRTKQLEYTWLQSLMRSPTQPRQDFGALTASSLEVAVQSLGLTISAAARHRLLDSYLDLVPFPDAEAALAGLAPLPRIILSNGTAGMLTPLVASSGLAPHIDAILSVDEVDIYKPSPRAYRLAVEHLQLPAADIGFVSSNGWDAIGARAFGFQVFWVNRNDAPLDRHGPPPNTIIHSLRELPALVGR